MTELIYNSPEMQRAIEFCWDTQRMLTKASYEGWHPERKMMYIKSRSQQWRRFSSGIRTEAHHKFMEQVNEQLKLPDQQRNPNRPVQTVEYLKATGRWLQD